MSGAAASVPLEIAVEAHNDDYDPDDDRWRDQLAGLYTDLRAQVDIVNRGRPAEGTKGAVDQLIIALGSAGAFTCMMECFRAWLKRDRNRRIDLRWNENGEERYLTVTGETVDAETVQEIAKAAVRRVGGQPWQAGTERS